MILQVLIHVLPGLIALALAAAVVLRLGSRRQKVAMTAVMLCWIGATLGQVLTGELTLPLIAGDAVFSLWLLWFAWRGPEWWVWVLLAVEAARLMLHSIAYGASMETGYTILNNCLSLSGLADLTAAALIQAWSARSRR